MRFALPVVALVALCTACVQHVAPYTPKRRDYTLPVDVAPEPAPAYTGSLWPTDGLASFLDADHRAARINDVLTVEVDEYSSASGDASTRLSREADVGARIQALETLVGGLSQLTSDGDLLKAGMHNDFDGAGKTSRSGRVLATVPVVVRQLFYNGNMFVEGQRVLLVNQEEQHFYISGVVRPQDIDSDNRVQSSRIADAQIEITGRGVLSEKNSPGWMARALDWLWPF